jgi:hypothetical protein
LYRLFVLVTVQSTTLRVLGRHALRNMNAIQFRSFGLTEMSALETTSTRSCCYLSARPLEEVGEL